MHFLDEGVMSIIEIGGCLKAKEFENPLSTKDSAILVEILMNWSEDELLGVLSLKILFYLKSFILPALQKKWFLACHQL